MKFSTIAALISDMDGVLWRGDELLPGVHDLFDWLNERQLPYILATNNSSRTQAEYVAKLAKLGIPNVPEDRILTSSIATAEIMRQRYPAGTRVHVLGMKGIRQALENVGFDLDDTSTDPVQVVVSGIDFELTYDKLKRAALLIRGGAEYIATNGDLTFPMPEGEVPGAGSIIAALQAATGVKPTVIGKPYTPMYEIALRQLNLSAERVLMLGDRLDTDIIGAKQLGMGTALVFTGVTQPDDLATSEVWADVAYEDMPAFLRAWAGEDWYRAKVKARRKTGANGK